MPDDFDLDDVDLDEAREAMGMTHQPAVSPQKTVVLPLADSGDDLDSFMANSGIQRERDVPNIEKPWMRHHEFRLVRDIAEINRIVDEAIANGKCSLDLETEGFDNRIIWVDGKPETVHKIVGFCLAYGDAKVGYYIPVRHRPDNDWTVNAPVAEAEAAIARLCWAAQPKGTAAAVAKDPLGFKEYETPPKVVIDFYNAKFDQEFLFPVTGIDWWHHDSFEDALLARFCILSDDKALGLKKKAPQFLKDPEGHPYEMIEMKDLFIRGRDVQFYLLGPDEPGALKYACSDAICTRLLGEHPEVVKRAREKHDFTYRLEKQVVQVVRVMERNRAFVNREKVLVMLERERIKREALYRQIQEFGEAQGWHGLDPNSPQQLSQFLFTDGPNCLNISVPVSQDFPTGKPGKNEKSGQYKTDGSTLEGLVKGNPNAPPILKWIVEFRGIEKEIGTYLENLYNNPDKNSELRFDFKQTGAATGRFSAPARDPRDGFSGVPIHGIPGEAEMRECFEARPGYTMSKCDYAGEELRVVTNLSGEPVWLKEFLEGTGDLHTITAKAFFGPHITKANEKERKMGKIANFALIYGGGPASIMRATGCDKMEGSRRKAAFDKSVPVFAKWVKGQHQRVKKDLGVYTAFQRWVAIPDALHPDEKIRAACERYATNYPIQGSGADIMKIAMVVCHKEFYQRGWLKTGGDDSVRILLTVHDELVFEIRHDRLEDAFPVIIQSMELPTFMARPAWKVPLVVEPLLGSSWGGKYEWDMIKKGKLVPPKEGEQLKKLEVRVGDRIYHKVPPWLEGIVKPGWADTGEAPASAPEATAPAPAVLQDAPAGEPPAPAAPPPSQPAPSTAVSTVTFRVNPLAMTHKGLRDVMSVIAKSLDPSGKVLCVLDPYGETLIDQRAGVRVNPPIFARYLNEQNIGDGKYAEG